MIPAGSSITNQNASPVQQPSRTWKLDLKNGRISGMTDKFDAVKQAVSCILGTERFRYLIYSTNYGVEKNGMIGRSQSLVESELKRRITEALKQDDRIINVTDFTVQFEGDSVSVSFTVISQFGQFEQEVSMSV